MAEKVLVSFEVDNKGAIKGVKQFRGELDETPKSAEKASRSLSKLGTVLTGMAVTMATVKLAQFMRESVQAASEQERVFNLLGAAMTTVGVKYNEVGKELQTTLSHLQATTRYGDDATAGVLQKLTVITGDYNSALKLLNPTLDFATAMHIDLESAARLAGQAATGMTGTLSRYGVILSESTKEQLKNADAMEKANIVAAELESRFGGAAAADLQTYGGRVDQLTNYWGDLQEAVGGVIIKVGAAPGVFNGAIEALKKLTDYVIQFGAGIVAIANFDFSVALQAYAQKALAVFLRLIASVEKELAKLPSWLGGGQEMEDNADELNKIADALSDISDIGIDKVFDDATLAAQNFRDVMTGVVLTTSGSGGVTESVEDVGDTVESVFDKFNDEILLTAGPRGKFYIAFAGMESIAKEAINPIPDLMKKAGEDGSKFFVDETDAGLDTIASSFSDLLGKGFTGEMESFADLWDEIWQDLAKSMVGVLGDAFETWLTSAGSEGGNGGIGGLFSGLGDKIKENPAGAIGGGIGGMYSAYQSGSIVQGILSGGMAGAGLGALTATPFGMVAGAAMGAAAGLLAGLFGGSDSPTSSGMIGLTGGRVTGTSSQELGEGAWDLFSRERVSEYREAVSGMNDILRMFGDSSLFDLVGDPETWSFDGRGTLESFATVFREQWLPEAMRDMFESAINQGLGDLGMTDASIRQLWDELGDQLGSTQLASLGDFVGTLVDVTNLMGDMDWNTILDESRMNAFEAFFAGMGDITDAIGTQMIGLDDMTLLERADQARTIESLMTSARRAEIAMLQQLDALQKSITSSLASQVEGIRVGGMNAGEKTRYYTTQINDIMAALRGGGITDPQQLSQMIADLQRYAGGYQQSLGESFYESGFDPSGRMFNPSEWIIGLLEEAGGLSTGIIDDMRDQVRLQNEALIAQLQLLIDALTDFTGVVGGDPKSGAMPDVNVPVEVTVNIAGDRSMFVKDVRAIVYAEMNRNQAMNGPANPHGVN